jgi:hypothetical protein
MQGDCQALKLREPGGAARPRRRRTRQGWPFAAGCRPASAVRPEGHQGRMGAPAGLLAAFLCKFPPPRLTSPLRAPRGYRDGSGCLPMINPTGFNVTLSAWAALLLGHPLPPSGGRELRDLAQFEGGYKGPFHFDKSASPLTPCLEASQGGRFGFQPGFGSTSTRGIDLPPRGGGRAPRG